jgi:lipopolysaccharide/colanic/teichoic acid biosynthesis glycosyltransferase
MSDVGKEYSVLNEDMEKPTLLDHDKITKKRTAYRFVKRVMDIVLSSLAIVILSPVFLITAICIKLDSSGPILFNQLRAGKNGVSFKVYKFRSMCKEADKVLKEMEEFKKLGAVDIKQRLIKDSRITKVGRIIRVTSIDELPQLANVFIGNMSIVGPRPLPIYEHDAMNEYQQKRMLVKPGLTCYWQVSGRSTLNEETRVKLDYKYIQEQGILTDIRLMLKTIPAVITRKGAY